MIPFMIIVLFVFFLIAVFGFRSQLDEFRSGTYGQLDYNLNTVHELRRELNELKSNYESLKRTDSERINHDLYLVEQLDEWRKSVSNYIESWHDDHLRTFHSPFKKKVVKKPSASKRKKK